MQDLNGCTLCFRGVHFFLRSGDHSESSPAEKNKRLIRAIFVKLISMKSGSPITRSAGIIIIGNEILSGKVQDVNSHFITSELRKLGVDVRRISVIPDETDSIGSEAEQFSRDFDYVFTTGGVGPTHDDVTMEGIARGFGVRLVQSAELMKVLSSRYEGSLNEWVLKMAEVPEGSEIIVNKDTRFPVVSFKNIFIFPGIPEYLRNKFSLVTDRIISTPFYIRRIFLNSDESKIAEILHSAEKECGNISIGSYPVKGNPEYRVIITIDSKSEEAVEKAAKAVISELPDEIVFRVE